MPDRQSVINRLNGIHAVACGMGNDQCYLNGIGIKQLQTLINDATALLKAQEPPTDEGIINAVYCLQNPHDCLEDEVAETRKMAMEALMAREPINAIVVNSDPSGAGSWWYACGKCNMPIDPVDKFCRHCGQAVKWE